MGCVIGWDCCSNMCNVVLYICPSTRGFCIYIQTHTHTHQSYICSSSRQILIHLLLDEGENVRLIHKTPG